MPYQQASLRMPSPWVMLASRFSASCHGCEGTLAQTHERRPSRENRTPFGDTLKAKGESPMDKVPRRRHHRSVDVLTEHLRASAKLVLAVAGLVSVVTVLVLVVVVTERIG